jgi:hypothetical protein
MRRDKKLEMFSDSIGSENISNRDEEKQEPRSARHFSCFPSGEQWRPKVRSPVFRPPPALRLLESITFMILDRFDPKSS